MNILVACDSFKGSLSSAEIIRILKETAEKTLNDVTVTGVQIADGGEGTLAALLACGKYKTVTVRCKNPFFKEITACYAIGETDAVIEMAAASGLTLIPYKDGNALYTTTYGTGELIRDAVCRGAKHIYICVGGSATNDGGIGALSALGFRFLDKNGETLNPTGESLSRITAVNFENVINTDGIRFTVVADVENPLLGENGATYVYGKQKGAVRHMADILEEGMKNYADITEQATGIRLHDLKSAGAAGGLGGGLTAYLKADVQSGIETVLRLTNFDSMVKNADAVITGEGKLDNQSLCGKAVSGVCKAAKKYNRPVYAVAGRCELTESELKELGIKNTVTLLAFAPSVKDSIDNAAVYMQTAAKKILKNIIEKQK